MRYSLTHTPPKQNVTSMVKLRACMHACMDMNGWMEGAGKLPASLALQ